MVLLLIGFSLFGLGWLGWPWGRLPAAAAPPTPPRPPTPPPPAPLNVDDWKLPSPWPAALVDPNRPHIAVISAKGITSLFSTRVRAVSLGLAEHAAYQVHAVLADEQHHATHEELRGIGVTSTHYTTSGGTSTVPRIVDLVVVLGEQELAALGDCGERWPGTAVVMLVDEAMDKVPSQVSALLLPYDNEALRFVEEKQPHIPVGVLPAEPSPGEFRQLRDWAEQGEPLPGQVVVDSSQPFKATCASPKPLQVALHAQRISIPGDPNAIIMGSDITTTHLGAALARRDDVVSVDRYARDTMGDFASRTFDLIVIEGFFHDLPDFIRMARERNPDVLVFHWCLSMWGIEQVLRYDVDGYFTNSALLVPILSRVAPTHHVNLGVPAVDALPEPVPEYAHNVVFLGMVAFHKKRTLRRMLSEAAPFGLVIYGAEKWANTEFAPFWKGKLPLHDVVKLYRSAKVVLAATVDDQKRLGMINNRIFEGLAAGAAVVSDHFDALEQHVNGAVLFHKRDGDTARLLSRLLNDEAALQRQRQRARAFALAHTYDARADSMMCFIEREFRFQRKAAIAQREIEGLINS